MRGSRKINKKWIWLTSFSMAILMVSGCGASADSEPTQTESNAETDSNQNTKTKDDELTRDDEIANEKNEIAEITEEVTVNEIIDGDTIVVINQDGEEETVELLLIETPEDIPEDTTSQQFGKQATDLAKFQLEGANVLLERGNPDKDENGHTLGHIWFNTTEGPENYAASPLLRGLAKVVTNDESNNKYLDEFREYEQQAKDEAKEEVGDFPLNIWSVEGYVTEDGFDQSLDF